MMIKIYIYLIIVLGITGLLLYAVGFIFENSDIFSFGNIFIGALWYLVALSFILQGIRALFLGQISIVGAPASSFFNSYYSISKNSHYIIVVGTRARLIGLGYILIFGFAATVTYFAL